MSRYIKELGEEKISVNRNCKLCHGTGEVAYVHGKTRMQRICPKCVRIPQQYELDRITK